MNDAFPRVTTPVSTWLLVLIAVAIAAPVGAQGTKQDYERELPSLQSSEVEDTLLQEIVDDAKDEVIDDLSDVIDWNEMFDIDDNQAPRVLNRLARYKAAELTVVRVFKDDELIVPSLTGAGGAAEEDGGEQNVLNYWRSKYRNLLRGVITSRVIILDEDFERFGSDVIRQTGPGNVI